MSWELVSFLILGAVLLAGFAWYERSRPPAQIVALVAALAALAIAGRIAFAAFPSVKPTTDIVIFAGYALGPAPGFAVGALAALVSNFWFGQGPWTPWQMAGWGLCGVLGAALAIGGRNAGRLSLAAVCGLAGIAYGALLNFSLMATYGGELSLERFGVLSARAVPFDVAHVISNVVLALVAGPAIVRMLGRFRRRFEWERGGQARVPARVPGIAVAAIAMLALAAFAPRPAEAAGAASAVTWLRSVQHADGGWGADAERDSGPEMTAWAMLGLEAAGTNPLDVVKNGNSPVDFLRRQVKQLRSPGDLARTILALDGAGPDPRGFGGRNLVADLRDRRRDNGSYEGWPNTTAYAAIALRAAGANGGVDKTMEWLRKVQNDDGGWGDVPGQRSNAEATGSVLQALSPDSKASERGLAYLRQARQSNGGYRLGGNGPINSQATAWAVQGILAAGANPDGVGKKGATTPLEYLAANQAPDGHYRYSKSSDQTPVWVTGQALVPVAGAYLPIATVPRQKRPKSSPSSSAGSDSTPGFPATGGAATQLPGSSPLPDAEALPASPSGSSSGGGDGGSSPNVLRPPGQDGSGAPAESASPGGREGEGSPAPAPEPPAPGEPGSAAAESGEGSSSSVAGSILMGLLAGALLVGAGLLGRKGWMRWRYGL